MKVRVIKRIVIEGRVYEPSPEILEVWPTVARKGIISGHLEDIEGNFIAAWTAREAYKKKIETRNQKGVK
jgi:hypothetical protein